MINRNKFFDSVRLSLFNGTLTQSQTDGMTAILDKWEADYSTWDIRWLAYVLATTAHETDRKMQPIEEYGKGKRKPYGQRLKYSGKPYTDTEAIFYGRGDVQITWYENYEKAGKALELDLLHHPELALRPDVAAAIMFLGMSQGWFTGKKLVDYIKPGVAADFFNARKIINGLDCAKKIADYANDFWFALL